MYRQNTVRKIPRFNNIQKVLTISEELKALKSNTNINLNQFIEKLDEQIERIEELEQENEHLYRILDDRDIPYIICNTCNGIYDTDKYQYRRCDDCGMIACISCPMSHRCFRMFNNR